MTQITRLGLIGWGRHVPVAGTPPTPDDELLEELLECCQSVPGIINANTTALMNDLYKLIKRIFSDQRNQSQLIEKLTKEVRNIQHGQNKRL